MKTFKRLNLFILSLLLVTFYNCNNESSAALNQDGSAHISIKLVDGPGDYDQVFVEVVDIMIKMNDNSEGDNGWESVGATAGVYDLLTLTGGQSAVLIDDYEVLAGELSQMRLILGENNYVVKDGVEYPLKTPSAQQSGLKLKINQVLEAGFLYSFVLDFDVNKSIVDAGNSNNIILKPVINASLEFASGIIQGAVTPFDFQTVASVVVDGETISSFTNENGVFMLYGVPAGTYDVTLTPDAESGYAEAVVSGVVVVNGEVTDIGTVELVLIPGSITGTILNAGVVVKASIMVNAVVVEVTADATTGVFLFENVPPGTYAVTLTPAEGSGLTVKVIADVVVEGGMTNDLGDITLV
jgi:hypothetical protein